MRKRPLALTLTCLLAAPCFAENWPDFLGPRRDAKSTETGLNWDWPATGPPIAWQSEIGVGYAGPAIRGEKLVAFGRHGNRDRVTCRNALTGEELWRTEHATAYRDLLGYNNGPRTTPVINGELVYTLSEEGVLQCLRMADGEVVWRRNTSEDFGVVKNFFGVGATPVVWGDLVIAQIGGSPPGAPADVYAAGGRVRSSGTGVVAFDKHTGDIAWKAADELASYSSPVVVERDDRAWCFVLARGGLVALDPEGGAVDFQIPWRAPLLESVNASTPVVHEGRVFISETYGVGSALVEFAPDAGRVVWSDRERGRDKALELHWNTPVLHRGFLYGSSGRHSGGAELRCVEWETGRVRWRKPGLTRASLLYAEGRLVCLGEDGVLRLLRATPERYEELARVVLRGPDGRPLLRGDCWTAPALAGGLLYVRGEDRLVCLDLR